MLSTEVSSHPGPVHAGIARQRSQCLSCSPCPGALMPSRRRRLRVSRSWCCPLLLSSCLPAEMLVAVSHLRSSVLVAEQEGRSPHAGMGKPGQSNARTPEPTPLPDCPGAEALSLDGPRAYSGHVRVHGPPAADPMSPCRNGNPASSAAVGGKAEQRCQLSPQQL